MSVLYGVAILLCKPVYVKRPGLRYPNMRLLDCVM